MKRILLFLFILLNAFLLCSCGDNDKSKKRVETMDYKIETALTNRYEDTHFVPYINELTISDNMFNVDNTIFNYDIAKLALCIDNTNSICNEGGSFDNSSYYLDKCMKQLGFNYFLSPNYNKKPTKDSVGYVIANKKYNDYDLIIFSVRGNNYEQEWVNNLTIGNGNIHDGIRRHANNLYEVLKAYLAYNHFDNPKLLISGFSRGGMIANVMGGILVDSNDLNIDKKDILDYGDLLLDINKSTITCKDNNQSIELVCKEFQLIEYFMKNSEQILSREQIYDKVWGMENEIESNNLEAYLSFIRKKLKAIDSKVSIKSCRGLGYKMEYNNE